MCASPSISEFACAPVWKLAQMLIECRSNADSPWASQHTDTALLNRAKAAIAECRLDKPSVPLLTDRF